MLGAELQITQYPTADLRLYHRNPRRGNVDLIKQSLTVNGQYKPVVVNLGTHTGRPYEVLAGNHTVKAARDLGWHTIAAVTVDVDDDQTIRIVAADNRTSDLGTYDDQLLLELLAELDTLDGTGYDPGDIADLEEALNSAVLPDVARPDEAAAGSPPENPITEPGDIWQLGPHRLICGDARDHGTVAGLLEGALINVAFTSPPYASQRVYDESSGFAPVPPGEYLGWFEEVQANVRAHLADDGSWFVNIKEHVEDGQRHLYVKDLAIAHVRRWGWRFVDELIWNKTDPFPGHYSGRFKNAFEPVLHFGTGHHKHRPEHVLEFSNTAIVHGTTTVREGPTPLRNETLEVATAPGQVWPSNVVTLAAGASSDGGHSAAFPAKLPAWFIRAYSDEGDVVFDPFMGSGTTLIAADNENRIAYGTEISPAYCDVICRRFEQLTGTIPVRGGQEHHFEDGA